MTSLAYVIDFAINNFLWDGRTKFIEAEFSCGAISMACGSNQRIKIQVLKFIRSHGCDIRSRCAFSEFPEGPKRQYARAMWLTWAALIAREEVL